MAEEHPKEPVEEDKLRQITVGELRPLNGPVTLTDYDPAWPQLFEGEATKIRAALGERVLLLEHAGSTSVPGLCAKPIIDIVLAVVDSSEEGDYVPDMEDAGYTLHIREPEWFEHRLVRGLHPPTNVHVFSAECEEVGRMLLLRDWMREHPEDRDLYAKTKRELATRTWRYTQDYANAKSAVVTEILARARAASVR